MDCRVGQFSLAVAKEIAAKLTFRDMVTLLLDFDEDMDKPRRVAKRLNTDLPRVSADFQDLYREECLGFWRASWHLLREPDDKDREGTPAEWFDSSGGWQQERVLNLVLTQIAGETLHRALPSMQVIAGAHAAIRSEGLRKHKPGDWADLRHAAAALPYCNVLLTDQAMKHLLTTPPLSFDVKFGCRVIGTVNEAIAYLKRVGDER